jgi:hypothetical protein
MQRLWLGDAWHGTLLSIPGWATLSRIPVWAVTLNGSWLPHGQNLPRNLMLVLQGGSHNPRFAVGLLRVAMSTGFRVLSLTAKFSKWVGRGNGC